MNKLHLALALLLSAGGAAASAAILVVRSTGPSAKLFPPGKSLAENSRITLKASDMLVVLDGRGTRTLKGPGTFSPGAPAQVGQIASAGTRSAPQRRARIGAVRGDETGQSEPRPPSLWHVDVSKSSSFCLADPDKAMLWRPDAGKAATLTVARAGAAPHRLEWPAGETILRWPAEIRITDGSDYALRWNDAAEATRIKFKTLPSRPAGLEQTASLLILNRCDAQLDLLIETLKLPEDPAPDP